MSAILRLINIHDQQNADAVFSSQQLLFLPCSWVWISYHSFSSLTNLLLSFTHILPSIPILPSFYSSLFTLSSSSFLSNHVTFCHFSFSLHFLSFTKESISAPGLASAPSSHTYTHTHTYPLCMVRCFWPFHQITLLEKLAFKPPQTTGHWDQSWALHTHTPTYCTYTHTCTHTFIEPHAHACVGILVFGARMYVDVFWLHWMWEKK